jgi:hypothetical protein
MSDLLRKSLQSPRHFQRSVDAAAPPRPVHDGSPFKQGDLVWYYGDAEGSGKKWPGTVLAVHPNGEEMMVQWWDVGKLGEKLGKEVRETMTGADKLARRDKYAIPPSPKPDRRRQKQKLKRLESNESLGSIGSALDVREFSPSEIGTPRQGERRANKAPSSASSTQLSHGSSKGSSMSSFGSEVVGFALSSSEEDVEDFKQDEDQAAGVRAHVLGASLAKLNVA